MMTLNTFIHELKRGKKAILLFSLGFFLFSVFYNFFVYKPVFVSESKVLLEEVSPITFVAELGKGKNLETNSQEKNPILTQIEVLSSQDIASRVYRSLVQQRLIKNLKRQDAEVMTRNIQGSLKLRTPPATDIIEVKVAWNDPAMSYYLNKTFLNEYRTYNIHINKESSSQAKKYIKEQLERSKKELQEARNQVRSFKKAKASIDINTEASNLVKEVQDTENGLSSLNSQISYHHRKVQEYASKLRIKNRNIKTLLESVALGQNSNLANLYKDLYGVEQQYAVLNVRYPDNTKKMTALKENINEIKKQIQGQILSTIGRSHNRNRLLIQDSVRTQMINDLISNQAEMLSLNAKRKSLQTQLAQLKTHEHAIPDVQAKLSELTDRELSLSSIVNALTSKLVEASVRESGIVSNINIVQIPTYPYSASFPSRLHVMLIMSILGASVGCLVVIGRYYLLDTVSDSDEIESLLHLPILGKVSWIPHHAYHVLAWNRQTKKIVSLECERIVTSLKTRCDDALNVIGFTSLSEGYSRSHIVASISQLLSECNYSVLIIDADFRNGTVAQEFKMDPNTLPDYKAFLANQHSWHPMAFKELVIAGERESISENIDLERDVCISQMDQFISKLEHEKSLYIMTHGDTCKNPYELITSKSFPILIERVKERFDYVLVDLPPFLEFPDTLLASRLLDTLVLICGSNMQRNKLQAVYKLYTDNSIKVIGTILKSFD